MYMQINFSVYFLKYVLGKV